MAFVLATAIVAIGFVVLGDLSSSDRVAVEATTTTSSTIGEVVPPIDPDNFKASQIATGDQMDWMLGAGFDRGFPIGVVEHEEKIYLFVTQRSGSVLRGGGMAAWRFERGSDWISLGQVIDERFLVSEVISTGDSLAAVGSSRNGGGIVVWMSDDALHWAPSEVSAETTSPYQVNYPTALGSTSDSLLIAASTAVDISSLVEDRARDAGFEFDPSLLDWGTHWAGESGHVLTINGPLGTKIQEISFDNLNLSAEERDWLANGSDPVPISDVWVQHGDSGWRHSEIEGAYRIESLIDMGDDGTLAIGDGAVGSVVRQSANGQTWAPIYPDSVPDLITAWEDDLVGVANSSQPELMTSDDGKGWQSLGLGSHFPPPISWTARALGTGRDGTAVYVEGRQMDMQSRSPEPVTIETGEGSILSLDFYERLILLETKDNTYRWSMDPPADLDPEDGGIEVHPSERTIVLLHPETREPLIEVGFAELKTAENDQHARWVSSGAHRVFVFTEDGSEWTIQDLSTEMESERSIALLDVASGRVVAVVQSPLAIRGLGAGSTATHQSGGFEVWTAEIP